MPALTGGPMSTTLEAAQFPLGVPQNTAKFDAMNDVSAREPRSHGRRSP
jgi:hypothetical protein